MNEKTAKLLPYEVIKKAMEKGIFQNHNFSEVKRKYEKLKPIAKRKMISFLESKIEQS